MANLYALDKTYMQMALDFAKLSKAVRAKVGAMMVTRQGIIIPGVNGMPFGWGNVCEDKDSSGLLVTKKEVIHAEENCLLKAAREGVSSIDATVYVTLGPCSHCCGMLSQAGIKRIVYLDDYIGTSCIDELTQRGIQIEKFSEIIPF